MGGGIGMGNTCKPMAVSFQSMTKFTTNKKKKKRKIKAKREGRGKKSEQLSCHNSFSFYFNLVSFIVA